jgi:hypothetical protein
MFRALRTSNKKPFYWVYSGPTKSVLYPPSSHRLHCVCEFTLSVAIKLPCFSNTNQCVIQLSLLLLLCCPAQGKSIKSGRTLIQGMSRHTYRRGTEAKIRSSEMLPHDECYIVTHLKKKHSAVQIFDPENSVTLFRNVGNTLSVSTT